MTLDRDDWIDAKTACTLLSVKRQTLYAYVSRAKIRVRSDSADARRSLYARSDVEAAARLRARSRARADVAQGAIRWGDPVLKTSIAEVRDGMLWLRGRSVVDCAEKLSFEDVITLLCKQDAFEYPPVSPANYAGSPFQRGLQCLAAQSAKLDGIANSPNVLIHRIVAEVSSAILGTGADGPMHLKIASQWGLNDEQRDLIRRVLVVLSDHELNPSTFAVRVCASTGANLASALAAGMATLSGVRHGGVSGRANAGLDAALGGAFPKFMDRNRGTDPYRFGFGHPLYPQGDPRARHLMEHLPPDAAVQTAVRDAASLLAVPPNIDMALAAVCRHLACPPDAAESLFAIARMAGWIAHALEQIGSGDMIRPRAQFIATET